ncbi:solute carrier family 35 member f1 [Trichuris trichiura]|uniref:Solute carrier family 35 member f1 n=1 Tax=Trichuris trichiura TaxID=36087 RepID=A0A077Z4F0_TRITR|nr:solute carrier family 35 member f1 [Trichuris trichiura]
MNDGTVGENDDGFDCSPCCANERFRRIVKTVLLGQLLSLCQCAAAITTQYLDSRYNFQAPTAQSFTAYFFLMLVYGSTLAFRSSEPSLVQIFRLRGWKYFVLALIDVEATFLIVKAYHYTGLASVQLLDCFTIPVVLVLSFFFLKIRYLPTHIIGVCLCLVGVGCVVWGDIELGHQLSDGSNRVAGDLMCLSGAALYGVSNVIQEWLLRLHERTEYLGMIGIFGSFISGIQLYIAYTISPRQLSKMGKSLRPIGPNIKRVCIPLPLKAPLYAFLSALLLLTFAISMFLFYTFVCVLIRRSSATMFNLSLLTADFYAFHFLFFVSFTVVVLGTIVYSWKETATRQALHPGTSVGRDMSPPVSSEDYAMKICPVHGAVLVHKPVGVRHDDMQPT